MLKLFKSLFSTKSAEMLALRELEIAKVQLLESLTAYEYFKKVCEYHTERIKRLDSYLNMQNK